MRKPKKTLFENDPNAHQKNALEAKRGAMLSLGHQIKTIIKILWIET